MPNAPYTPSPTALPLLGPIAGLLARGKIVEQSFRHPPKIPTVLPGGQL